MSATTVALASLLSLIYGSTALACHGCGCQGGPGYRGPDGKCVSWSKIRSVCGSPPTKNCTAELPNKGAEDAAKIKKRAPAAAKPK